MNLYEAIKKFLKWQSLRNGEKTRAGYEVDLRSFCLWARNPVIEDIDIDDIMDYFTQMRDLEWRTNAIARKATAIREFFRFLALNHYHTLDSELIPVPEREYTAPRIANREDYFKMIATWDETDRVQLRNKALALLLWDSMGRIGEVLSLNVSDIDLNESHAIMRREKARKSLPFKEIFWTEETNEALRQWIKKRDYYKGRFELEEEDALFIGLHGKKRGMRIHQNTVREIFRLACIKAKVPYMNPHAVRHAGGQDLALQGANNSTISSLLGHSSILSSFVYTRLKDKSLKEQWVKYRNR